MRIKRNGRKIMLDQIPYLQRVIERFGMTNAKSTTTPLPSGYQPSLNKNDVDPALRSRFQSVIGSLLYLMIGTHPDIAYSVIRLLQFSANPSKEHLDKALYICRYLVGTQQYSLNYDGNTNKGLIAHTDSDWASDSITRRSTTGFFVKLAAASTCWISRSQKTVALSSTEAEYMAMSDCCRQMVWIKSLFSELGYDLSHIPIVGDNQGSQFIASNPVQERRTKHIDIRYHYIRECVEEGKVSVFFIDGNKNPADMFTKNLAALKFLQFREHLGLEFYSPSSA